MNIKLPKVPGSVVKAAGKARLIAKDVSPTVLVIGGVAGLVTAAIMACKATRKFDETMNLEQAKKDIDAIHKIDESKKAIAENKYYEHNDAIEEQIEEIRNDTELSDENKAEKIEHLNSQMYLSKDICNAYTGMNRVKDLARVYGRVGKGFVKLYGVPIAIGMASVGMVFGSNYILETRNAALASAYAALQTSFNNYRKKIEAKYGDDTDKSILLNEHKEKCTATIVDPKSGKEKTVTRDFDVIDIDDLPDNAIVFDEEHCKTFANFPDYDVTTLFGIQNTLTDILNLRGYVFENELRRMLGAEETRLGQMRGWSKDGRGAAGYVSFNGDYNGRYQNPKCPEFIRKKVLDGKGGYEVKYILLLNLDPEPLIGRLDKIVYDRTHHKEAAYA